MRDETFFQACDVSYEASTDPTVKCYNSQADRLPTFNKYDVTTKDKNNTLKIDVAKIRYQSEAKCSIVIGADIPTFSLTEVIKVTGKSAKLCHHYHLHNLNDCLLLHS